MDDSGNRRESRHSYQQNNDSWDRREEYQHRRDRNRDYDDHSRSRRRDRDKRRSRSRSKERERHGSRRYHDRDDYAESASARSYSYADDYSRREHSSSTDDKPRPENDWRLKLTDIRDAHFNRSKQAPSIAQNQFTNDGSFLEKFKQMAGESSNSSNVLPNSLVLASSSIKYNSEISLPPLTTLQVPEPSKPSTSTVEDQDLDGVPIPMKQPIPVPVSVGRRRTIKPLKTGVVFKKTQQSEEDEASQEKLDAWARYLQEVQKYKKDNCVEEDASRPLVK